ncbi:MAG: glycogen debranching protein GlgX [Propionibacteriales bacterium]|nr:glycogen debranching protein GlgX [Propionibacteriales bacterium]
MSEDSVASSTVLPGHHQQLGATYDGDGTNFAVWAPGARQLRLCLFDRHHRESQLALPARTLGVWHGYVPAVEPGQHYGFRADGDWDPATGQLGSVDKLLLDPYARAIDKTVTPHPALKTMTADGRPNPGDTAPYTPRSVVVGRDDFDWGDDLRLETPWQDTVIYEAHVKGLTQLNPDIPEHQRGSFAAAGHPSTVGYLADLGVTALELLPVHHFLSEPALAEHGLVNYWGYSSIGFFAPHAGYSAGGTRGAQVTEFKQMVKSLHAAGIEVILDVVYNHTAEGDHTGPTLCFRGLDDGAYYRGDHWGRYADVSGCGNTVNVSHPQVLRLVMDSLRYWVTQMHVDGFRFDLAPALARNGPRVDLHAPFLTAIHQDPVLREVKLIAEPWDATGDGYLLGRFPPPWCEWNDKYRDAVRDFWRGKSTGVGELASRVSGSNDLYADDGRHPFSPVNIVTAHDGFTLRDLVTYDNKHNEANCEGNRDGTGDNRSWNCGVEGETDDSAVTGLRQRQAANMLATLLVSTGVPMVTAGDERGRTQRGNNNAFCQDNEISWLSWDQEPEWTHLRNVAKTLIDLRAKHLVLRQRAVSRGTMHDDGHKAITWLHPSGEQMTDEQWHDATASTVGAILTGVTTKTVGAGGNRRRDTSFLLWFHAGQDPVTVTLPARWADYYRAVLRTDAAVSSQALAAGSTVTLLDHTFAVFEAVAR